MAKLAAALIIAGICLAIINNWMEGGGGLQAVQITASLSKTDNHVHVSDTSGFLDSDYLSINDEYFYYTSKTATTFDNVTRGVWDTEAATHNSGAYVYTEGAAAINKAMGFNVAAIGVSNGFYTVATVPFRFFTVTLPYLIFFQSSIFDGELLSQFRYVLLGFGIGFYVVLAIAIGQVVAYSLRR